MCVVQLFALVLPRERATGATDSKPLTMFLTLAIAVVLLTLSTKRCHLRRKGAARSQLCTPRTSSTAAMRRRDSTLREATWLRKWAARVRAMMLPLLLPLWRPDAGWMTVFVAGRGCESAAAFAAASIECTCRTARQWSEQEKKVKGKVGGSLRCM